MTRSHYSNVLILTGVFTTLGIGIAGCAEPGEDRAARATNPPSMATAAKITGDAASEALSDTWITSKVKSVLLADPDAKGLDVNVETQNGVVSLKGELTSQAAIDHVRQLAEDVEGVKRVNASALTVVSR